MKFSEVIGQEELKKSLIRSVQENRISHSQMFFGPEGTGKLALALAYAQYISCQNKQENDSCGTCPSCLKYQKLIHPDLHFVFPVIKAGSNRAVSDNHIEEWRNFVLKNPYFNLNQWLELIDSENKQGMIYVDESSEILRKLSLKAYESDWKIMIIWLPERMNPTAANKLLKILEEPPEQTLFILVSENTHLILPTILSRVQMIRVPRISDNDLLKTLEEKHGVNEGKARLIMLQAAGNYARVLTLLEATGEDANFDRFVLFMRLAWKDDVAGMIDWVDDIAETGRVQQKEFLQYSLRMIRENLLLNLRQPYVYRLTDNELEFSRKFSKFITPVNTPRIEQEFSLAQYHIESNGNSKVVFLDLILKVAGLIKN